MKANSSLVSKVRVAFGAATLTLLIVAGFGYRAMIVSDESARWVRHTYDVLEKLQDMLSGMQNAESSMRGFVLTGQDRYVVAYQAGLMRAANDLGYIQVLTADNPQQQERLRALQDLSRQKIELAEQVKTLRQTHGLEAAESAIFFGQGQQIMDQYRQSVYALRDEELRLLVHRDLEANTRSNLSKTIMIAGALLGLLVVLAAGWSVQRDSAKREQAEAALLSSDEKYRMLLNGVQDYAIVMLDPAGRIISWNAGAEHLKRYTAEQIIGQNFSSLFSPQDIQAGKPEEILRVTAATGRREEESVRVRKDGSQFLAGVTTTALRNPDGSLQGFCEISRDISESKESVARYRGLLEAAPDAIVVVDQSGNIVLLNVQAEKQFGYRRDELVGQPVKNIIPEGFAERIIADGIRTPAEALAQQIGTGIELNALRRDGTVFPIEIMLSPLENADGILVTAAIRDISVRRAAEKHLLQMEGRYRGLLEAAPDAMVVVNQAGDIVLLNVQAEKQFGYHRDELLGQPVKNILPVGFAERLIADALRSSEDALAQQIGTGIELDALRKDGSGFPIELMLSPLTSPEGILVTAAIRDISVRRRAEAHLLSKVKELNRSNEELGQFAYIASHDLQEPLRMVASYTQLLSRRYKGKLDSDADDFIAFAVDGASRMQRLIQDLLTYSRVGTKGAELLATSSEEALGQAVINLRGAIQESGALVTHDPLPTILADGMQLIQLFQNLVGNAIKYQNAGIPKVHISAAKEHDGKWLFSVKDNGLGIDPQYFEKIFGMFQRLHKRTEFAGTGIGLAICKKIVERHGGTIGVESEPGDGTVFRFALFATGEKA